MTTTAVGILLLFLVAHFLGDFTPLATPRMQTAKAIGRPIGPIAAHALVHAVLVGLALLVTARPAAGLLATASGIEFGTHLAIDWTRGRISASHSSLRDPSSQAFWSFLGLDQLAHALVLVWIAFLAV